MERPRKKVVIIGSAYPLRGGLSNFNERLGEEFLATGWDVVIYTFSLQYPSFLFPGKTQLSSESYAGNLDIKVAVNSINPINWIRVGRELRHLKPNLVVIKFWIPFMAPCLGTIARIVRKNGITKVVTIIDNIIPHEKRPGDKLLAKYFAGGIDGFVAMSRKVLNDISLFDTSKPRIFSAHPIYDNFGKSVSKEEAVKLLNLDPSYRYILFFGFIRDYKGLDILIKAMSDPDIANLRIKLLVAGEFYSEPKAYVDLIREFGVEDRIILSNDFIPDNEVYKYFSACDLVVQPYKSATQSGVTQIAYHFDKPMVITNVGGLEEFVPDGKVGFVVNPMPTEVADAIVRFYKSNLSDLFLQNIRNEKKKYSWIYFLNNIKSLFNL
ncbi:D-inositol-3-phosphate glycosyltransferase [bioreactor metagenome]|jgi:glycosyltransferase involved in cell wall biosynthesis|uniref:D-inositol-3-phosphate glycosyltransferase n=1 Tax=bioreactor metagenome TaxID=1076179 RepID=A0A644TUF5_9ZZZZ|nr:glycosyltransferase [Lentimicrobium sp.]MEA5111279.1 glycosyltransferase [Lentimicrobium sp.]